MVTKRIRSEYTKKFKDPKWESYSRCYEELLKYRRTRRLLEQSHNPWFWGECASDTTESGTSTPQRNNKVEPLPLEDQVPPTCENVPEPEKEPKTVENQEGPAPCESPDRDGSVCLADPEVTEPGEGDRNLRASPAAPAEVEPEVSAKPKSRQLAGTFRKSTRPKSQPRRGQDTKETKDSKENKHPFALYGWGERQADMASKKTHNVCPAASTKEIHESALRAKTRREVEKQMKKMDKRRTRSADIDKIAKSKIVPDFDPWMTEYMRCFSVRSR